MTNTLEKLKFDNRFVVELPGDPVSENSCRMVKGACYSEVLPRATSGPELACYSAEVAEIIGIDEADCQSELFRNVFSGNDLLPGMTAYASCYGGHQFGQWAGQLGDGRAINLGEVVNQQDQHWTLQLKGSGPTPYSRHSDGLAVLRSSVREFLCSEAMYHLGVPTTRALSLCLTGDDVLRDMFYDGNPIYEPGAVVCRVAPSFTRFGNFQLLTSRDDIKLLEKLLNHTIKTDFPHLGEPSQAVYQQWFQEVCQLTKEMIIHWMRVGFVHGVMNTDNMSILGLTIDYGPYGWLEGYDQQWTPNTTDAEGKRYCFGRQPVVAHWNLMQLAQAIAPLIDDLEPIKQALDDFCDEYGLEWHQMMLSKLGLTKKTDIDDGELIVELLEILQLTETDMTIFFRRLADIDIPAIAKTGTEHTGIEQNELPKQLVEAYYQQPPLSNAVVKRTNRWLTQYANRTITDKNYSKIERKQQMDKVNPKYVLRNYLAQLAIDKSEQGDHSMLYQLLDVLRLPYDEQPENEQFAAKRPEWARHKAGCSMLSCSS